MGYESGVIDRDNYYTKAGFGRNPVLWQNYGV